MPVKVNILACDIVHADELVSAVVIPLNTEKIWYSELDYAVKRTGGLYIYNELVRFLMSEEKLGRDMFDGQTILIDRDENSYDLGNYLSVLFVFDDLKRPLVELMRIVLEKAKSSNLKRIAIPMIRTGWYKGKYEKTEDDALRAILATVYYFAWNNQDQDMIIDLVTFNNPRQNKFLKSFDFLNN